jgi:hypothetical protein
LWAEARHDDWPGYVFRLTFAGGELLGIEVRREDPDAAPLTAHNLQRVPLGALERAVRQNVDIFETLWTELVDSSVGLVGDKVITTRRVGMSPAVAQWFDTYNEGANPKSPERLLHLARLANRYVETLGEPGQTDILAEEFHYQPSSVSKMVREARDCRLLSPTTKGRPGGSLTPRARALLDETEE